MKRKTTDEFIREASITHNNKYDYSGIEYSNGDTKIRIVCPTHGEFWQLPKNHLYGQGCRKCKYENLPTKSNSKEFIAKCRIIHKRKYNYSKVVYVNNHTKIEIVCPIHGSFLQTPQNHLCGKGCAKCGGTQNYTLKEVLKKFDIIHRNKYDYNKVVYKNMSTKVLIICPTHGGFYQLPYNHVLGMGCPKCSSSKGELKIQQWLDNNKIGYVYQKKFDDCINPKTNYRLTFDFFVSSQNLLIEYDGKQHFHSGVYVKKHMLTDSDLSYTKYKDELKNVYAQNKGIELLRISYDNITKIPEILESRLSETSIDK